MFIINLARNLGQFVPMPVIRLFNQTPGSEKRDFYMKNMKFLKKHVSIIKTTPNFGKIHPSAIRIFLPRFRSQKNLTNYIKLPIYRPGGCYVNPLVALYNSFYTTLGGCYVYHRGAFLLRSGIKAEGWHCAAGLEGLAVPESTLAVYG